MSVSEWPNHPETVHLPSDPMKRRSFLSTLAAASTLNLTNGNEPPPPPIKLGVSIASYGLRWRNRGKPQESWRNALDVLDHCAQLGAGCLQIGVRDWQHDFAGKVRIRREKLGLEIEGQISLPKGATDLDRFATEVKSAKEAGAKILRSVCLSGRRYETFKTLADWNTFREQSIARLTLAEPIVRRQGMILAIENHKDWRSDEFVELLEHFDSECIGVNFDFGNNLALLEDPQTVAEALAPWIRSTHIKDMGVQETGKGFLLSEVPLGQGILDLPKLVATCRRHFPAVQFNLEMITRDPLLIPCLEPSYWTTLLTAPATDLARTLSTVKQRPSESLPHISDKSPAAQLAFEEQNNVACFEHGLPS